MKHGEGLSLDGDDVLARVGGGPDLDAAKALSSHQASGLALTGVPLLQKLMDRFTIRVPLSDTDVETVTRKVLLQKKPGSPASRTGIATRDCAAGEA